MKLQFTLFSTTGKYRPVSTLVEVNNVQEYNLNKDKYRTRAIQKICAEKNTEWWALKMNGFTRLKVRVYDREKIAKENAERYERIKKERGWE